MPAILPASVSADVPPVALSDAFLEMIGDTSVGVLMRVWDTLPSGDRPAELEKGFLASLTEGLLEDPSAIEEPANLGIPLPASERRLDNVFYRNVQARALAVCIARAYRKSGGGDTHRDVDLGSLVVPLYLSFVTAASESVPTALLGLLKATSSEGVSAGATIAATRQSAFRGVIQALEGALDSAWGGDLRSGLKALIDAMMIVREAREEEAALTVDVKLPLNCSWDLIYEAANNPGESVLAKANLSQKQELLKLLGGIPRQELVDELEDLSRHLGRGVSLCSLRERRPINGGKKSFFQCQNVWPSHEGAPLSQLYDLAWAVPSELTDPDVRLIMYAESTILLSVQGDSFLEYRRGVWRYVDLWGKTRVISRVIEPKEERAEVLDPPLYRVSRLAYQLAYHHHGATIDLNLEEANTSSEHLNQLKEKWDVKGITPSGLALIVSAKGETEDTGTTRPTHMGRLAYALCLQDGMSVWDMPKGSNELNLREFGEIITINGEQIMDAWREMAKKDGFTAPKLGGGRHYAAFGRSLEQDKLRVVFCVSQDGSVDVFSGKHWMPLR